MIPSIRGKNSKGMKEVKEMVCVLGISSSCSLSNLSNHVADKKEIFPVTKTMSY